MKTKAGCQSSRSRRIPSTLRNAGLHSLKARKTEVTPMNYFAPMRPIRRGPRTRGERSFCCGGPPNLYLFLFSKMQIQMRVLLPFLTWIRPLLPKKPQVASRATLCPSSLATQGKPLCLPNKFLFACAPHTSFTRSFTRAWQVSLSK